MTEARIKQYSGLVDLVLILSGAMLMRWPFMALALLLIAARRWPIFCRGVLGSAAVTPWILVFLPGAKEEKKKNETEDTPDSEDKAPTPTNEDAEPMPAFAGAPPRTDGVMTTEQWRDALDESPHLYIYGPSKAGKSTLAQAVVAMFDRCAYVVVDPVPNKPGERKWGGIDFITTDESGDEYASIGAALDYINAEDERRRRTARNVVHPPLVVIIDEVLQLVSELGTITNDEGRKEPRMSHFIRTKGYSARHRNIKIILIGQGKNLRDLGLESATARDNYALVRAARNPANNQRSAYIATEDGERPIELKHVPALAQAATGRAKLWLSHTDVGGARSRPEDELARLLGQNSDTGIKENAPKKPIDTADTSIKIGGIPDMDTLDRDTKIKLLVSLGVSANGIYQAVGGNRNEVLARIAEISANIK